MSVSFLLNEGSELIFIEHFVAGTVLGPLSHLNKQLEGGERGDVFQMRKYFEVKPVPKVIQLKRHT